MMKNCVFYFGISSFVSEIKKLMMSQTLQMSAMNHKIENISENIGVMIFKLCTSNAHQIKAKGDSH